MPTLFSGKQARPAGVGIRSWREIAKNGMFRVGVAWDRWFKMRHFQPDAHDRYGYAQRTAKHLRRKAARGVPKFLDLVYTGTTRRVMSRIQIPRVFPTRVSFTFPTPDYVMMRPNPKKRKAPNLGEEMTRVTAEETEQLEAVFAEYAEAQAAAHLERVTVTGR